MGALPEDFGKYRLIDRLGRGASSEVFLAFVRDEGAAAQPLVIKRILGNRAEDPLLKKRVLHEAKLATLIDSRNVVRLVDVGSFAGRLYLAMEYICGWPLSRVLGDLSARKQLPSLASVVEIIAGALLGLKAIHEATDPELGTLRMVHRDIAPKNIMIARDGTTRLIDLGIGRSLLKDWETHAGNVVGTPSYMSPEQARGQVVDARSDIYSMGVVLFEFLTLTRYIARSKAPTRMLAAANPNFITPTALRNDVPEAISDVVRRALDVEPAARFASAGEFREALLEAHARTLVDGDVPTLIRELIARETEHTQADVTRLVQQSATAVIEPTPLLPALPLSRTPRRSLRTLAAGAIGAVAVATALAGTTMRRTPESEPSVVPQAPRRVAEPSAVSVEAPGLPPVEAPVTLETKPPRSRRPPSKVVPESPVAPSPQLETVIARAKLLRAALKSDAKDTSSVDHLLGEMLLEIANPDSEARQTRVERWVRELRGLEN